MNKKNKMHFEVSERKIVLRIFDVVFVLIALFSVGKLLDLDYLLEASISKLSSILILGLLINGIGTIFEMYNLQIASNQYKVMKNCILTCSVVVLVYLLTPVFSAGLPTNRFQILIFYCTVLTALILWRTFYVKFLASNRFLHNVILICNREQVDELVAGLENADPHYKIVAYVQSDKDSSTIFEDFNVPEIKMNDLGSFVTDNSLFEIVVASKNVEDINLDLYQKSLHLLKKAQ